MCQFILEDDPPVAVWVWCAAAWHLKDRDTQIGWDAVTRCQRLKLVAQLPRFLVLEETRRPNLASQCLGLGLRELSTQWLAEQSYRPLLAEGFSDPESHAGTVYKATNWIAAGDTKGLSQNHTDNYMPNERPKKKCCQGIRGKYGQTTVAPIKAWRGSPAEPPRPLTAGKDKTTAPHCATSFFLGVR